LIDLIINEKDQLETVQSFVKAAKIGVLHFLFLSSFFAFFISYFEKENVNSKDDNRIYIIFQNDWNS
jgi:hypothetical protein